MQRVVVYGARGFVAHHNTDLWRVPTPVDGARWGLWPMGAAWLSTHLFEHYAFGGDPAFLRKAYPVLKVIGVGVPARLPGRGRAGPARDEPRHRVVYRKTAFSASIRGFDLRFFEPLLTRVKR